MQRKIWRRDEKVMDDLNAKIIETHRDVKWICRTLKEMKETDADFEARIRDLEGWRAEKAGAEMRTGGIVAGLSGVAGAFVAWVVQWLGVG
ncbi:hypothetical protein [Methanogenium organophilum]|uniref:Uncharacterized protein n=1 Tax=Methanogenium organophilum TaxID=2199 RepID=A0A9X9S2N2_METOG|nr:hypothetical protein [Methanogenium organophilum]WAI00390.1 hypothetical protein OU421_08090 [Methanogenium organophilum]